MGKNETRDCKSAEQSQAALQETTAEKGKVSNGVLLLNVQKQSRRLGMLVEDEQSPTYLPTTRSLSTQQDLTMSTVTLSKTGNRLLDDLPLQEFRRVVALCKLTNLPAGKIICEKGLYLSHVYFPLTACLSKVAEVPRHPPLGMVQIGSEGMLGATLILGVEVAPLRAIVQCPGTALCMEVRDFHDALLENPSLRVILGRYLYVLLEQLSQAAACTRFHDVETRLVRWLLLTHDRSHADQFHLTHQILADMLGVQRSAVTIAAGILQQNGLISYSRGEISILNRAGLEAKCCECYETVQLDYERLIA